jgi:hypothetical protein
LQHVERADQRLARRLGTHGEGDAVSRRGADQRGAAHQHGADGMRGLFERGKAQGNQRMRQLGLIDDADRRPVRLEPDRAHRLALNLHDPSESGG